MYLFMFCCVGVRFSEVTRLRLSCSTGDSSTYLNLRDARTTVTSFFSLSK